MPQHSLTALMTTYNSDLFVEKTVESVLKQSYPDFQFLILDDGSTDSTEKRIRQFDDPRIRLVTAKTNIGVGARLQQALHLIQSEFIVKIDSDDISQPERFEKQLHLLQAEPSLGFVKSYVKYFSDDPAVAKSERFERFRRDKEHLHNSVNTPEKIEEEIRRWNCVLHTTYMGRTSLVRQLGYPDVRVGEDYSLFYRAAEAGIRIGCVPEVLVNMRLSATSVTTRSDSALLFAQQLIQLKMNAVHKLLDNHHTLWIFGTGQLARGVAFALKERGIVIQGFIDRRAESKPPQGWEHLPVLTLTEKAPGAVIIAAQPVRQEISDFYQNNGWKEWHDYMVIA